MRDRRLLFVELKRDRGRLTDRQQRVLDYLKATRAEVYVWRPADWDDVMAVLV